VIVIEAHEETWPLKETFRISRGSRTKTQVIVATVSEEHFVGRGEATPIRRYNQTLESVLTEIETLKGVKELDRQKLQTLLPAGAARNAIDCALWDLEAKRSGERVWDLAGVPMVDELQTTFTISLGTPEEMAAATDRHPSLPMLKLKLGGDVVDLARVKAVRASAPNARLIVDANESWSAEHFRNTTPKIKDLGVELIEQPFPADSDEILETFNHPIPVCADESCHTTADLPRLRNRYEVINVKLDKTGGLTEALRLCKSARTDGFKLLIGCMVGTSLSMAPARILASAADYVDLDGPLLLSRDRDHGITYGEGKMHVPSRELWG
jgi:L-alanine-DL-glutamate epimerase-like enolase superfamily enzyme